MQITTVDHRDHDFKDGLCPLHLRDLKRIVLLAGPNGSGKTRVLTRILGVDGQVFGQFEINYRFDFGGPKPIPVPDVKNHKIGIAVSGIGGVASTVDVKPFIVQSTRLQDQAILAKQQLLQLAEQARTHGAGHLTNTALPYLSQIQQQSWESSHPNSEIPKDKRDKFLKEYKDLEILISAMLNEKLSRNEFGDPTLFGKPIAQSGLSHGQQSLLQWAIALHAQKAGLGSLIITMDEPENHLHPEALIDTIARVIDVNRSGQVWMGTHSVPLIAALLHRYPDDISLYYMDSGQAHFAGRAPEKVLQSLMGGESNIQALREFIDLPEMLATIRFAAECLLPPKVLSGETSDDPQAMLAEIALFEGMQPKRQVKVLDFGAGRGRLLECLAAADGDLANRLDYVAWDVAETPDPHCVAAISKIFGDADRRWFNNFDQLAGAHGQHIFDAVIMCNVLHEIEPQQWNTIFSPSGTLVNALKPDGELVIVEDYLMPKGEYAHPYGFIVLDTAALQKLFGMIAGGPGIKVIQATTERYKDRIKAHVVPASLLRNVSGTTIRSALDLAISSAEGRLAELRGPNRNTFRDGQAHAFWVQQFTNATLARKALD